MFIKTRILKRALQKRLSISNEWEELRRRNPNVINYIEKMQDVLAGKAIYGKELIKYEDACKILTSALLGYNYIVEMQEYENRTEHTDRDQTNKSGNN